MNNKIIQKVENFAREYCKDKVAQSGYEDRKLWDIHIQLTRKYALRLAEIEGANKEVVEIAALLHDIGKYKGREEHEKRSYQLSKDFLKDLGLPKEKRDLILICIAKHGSKHSMEDNEVEVKVIQSADALGTLFDEEWQTYCRRKLSRETLLRLFEKTFNKINLKSARDIAKSQITKLRQLVFINR